VRIAAVIAAGALALVAGVAPRNGEAHLVVARSGLARLASQCDGVVAARVVAATQFDTQRDVARTRFRALAALAGDAPQGEFVVETSARAALRHVAGQSEIVFVSRGAQAGAAAVWGTPQESGLGIALEGDTPSAATQAAVRALWREAHGGVGTTQTSSASPLSDEHAMRAPIASAALVPSAAVPGGAAAVHDGARAWGRALVPALHAPERKLRVLAVLDLAALAHAPGDLDDATVGALSSYGAAPDDDAALRPALDAILGATTGRSS